MGDVVVFEYSSKGLPVNDFEVKQLADEYVKYINGWLNYKDHSPVFYYSTSNIFMALKLKVALGELDHNSIIFRYNGKYIHINEYGAIPDWPDGFCDIDTQIAEDTLRAAMARRRVELFEAEDR